MCMVPFIHFLTTGVPLSTHCTRLIHLRFLAASSFSHCHHLRSFIAAPCALLASSTLDDPSLSNVMYECLKANGTGAFGVVYKARHRETKELVAIKRIFQDRRCKTRELELLKLTNHTNIVQLKDSFFETTKEGVYLNLVLEYIPLNLYQFSSQCTHHLPLILVKTYTYQLLRAVSYIHNLGIVHRDIKPQNLLINQYTHELKLCDFGSAKILQNNQPSVAYICSRYYRAPELIFDSRQYTSAIDVWSVGCVMAEMILGKPLFAGESQAEQLIEIIRVLGTPTVDEIKEMNPNYRITNIAQIQPHPWKRVFPPDTPVSAIDLIVQMISYIPSSRINPLVACVHPFFDELRDINTVLPSGKALPDMFNFLPDEIMLARRLNILDNLTPPHCHKAIAPNWLANHNDE